jgi:low affinity Fe/Cu permease
MSRSHSSPINRALERLSEAVTNWSGTSAAFVSALGLVVLWLLSGPIFHFSDTWQLVINTTTTVVTFLMVFLIQRSQTKSVRATFIKLNELIASIDGASNRLIEVEDLSEAELDVLQRHFRRLVEMARQDGALTRSHSVEEATERHQAKANRRRPNVAGRSRSAGRRRRNGASGRGPAPA